VGGSAGCVMDTAFKFIKEKGWQNDKSKRIVCVFSDSIRNYISSSSAKSGVLKIKFFPMTN
jgi:cysteine synthase